MGPNYSSESQFDHKKPHLKTKLDPTRVLTTMKRWLQMSKLISVREECSLEKAVKTKWRRFPTTRASKTRTKVRSSKK